MRFNSQVETEFLPVVLIDKSYNLNNLAPRDRPYCDMAGAPFAIYQGMGLRKLNYILIAMILTISAQCLGALMPMSSPIKVDAPSKVIDVMSWIEQRNALVSERSFDITRYVSISKIHRGMDEGDFSQNFVETTLRNLSETRFRSISRTLDEVEKVASADFKLSEDQKNPSSLKMQMDVVRAEAKLAYNGSVNAQLKYQISDSELQFELSKNVGHTQVIAAHTENDSERKDTLGVRWAF